AIAAGAAACGRAPIRPMPISVQAITPGAPAPCTATQPPPLADARWRPQVTGALRLEGVAGEPRLTDPWMGLVEWSPDAKEIVVAEGRALVIWRVRDGRMVSIHRYPNGELLPRGVFLSPDGRWIVVTAVRER